MQRPSTDDLEAVAELAAAFGLGDVVGDPISIKAGAVASCRLRTTRGEFHVKRFARADWDWLQQTLTGCAEIELGAQRAGVEMAEPIALNERVGAEIVSVHRWWDGRVLEPTDDVAGWLGGTLARLHTVPPPTSSPPDALNAYYGFHPLDDWRQWFAEGQEQAQPWAIDTADGLDAVLFALKIIGSGLAAETGLVGSHHDLHSLNVLTKGGRFAVIDWDCAGPEVPWFETVRAAVEFGRLAGTRGGNKPLMPDGGVAREVIGSYIAAGGERGIGGREALAGVFGMMLWRMGYSMWRSLGHRTATPEERAAEASYVEGALAKLMQRVREVDELAALLGV